MRKIKILLVSMLAILSAAGLMAMKTSTDKENVTYPSSIHESVIEEIENKNEQISVVIIYKDRVLERDAAFRSDCENLFVEQGYSEDEAKLLAEQYYEENRDKVNDEFYLTRNAEIIEYIGIDMSLAKTLYHVPSIEAELSVDQILKAAELEYVFMIRTSDYKSEIPTFLPEPSTYIEESALIGDANCDGRVLINDAILVMQAIGNPDVYGVNGSDPSHITKQGIINADVCNPGDGITNKDALTIQKYLIHMISGFPDYS